MGRKYASIHIYTNDQDTVLSAVDNFYNNDTSMDSSLKQAIKLLKNAEAQQMLERQFRLTLPNILIIQSKKFISIYDENISFETVEDRAKALSIRVDEPIMYVSNFDDDVLVFGIYRNGNLITSRNLGEGLALYDIIPANLDMVKFCNELKIEITDSMDYLNDIEIIDEIEDKIENILQVPLKLTLADIQYDFEQFLEKYIADRVHVFEMI